MKKIIAFLFYISATQLFGLDRLVDPALSSGNGTTMFTTITSAVSASANGDRIVIKPGTYNEPTLTLNKSLILLSQTPGTTINYNGNMTIAGSPGMKLSILGFNLGIYSISSNAITGGIANNRAQINIIECKMTNLSIDQDYYELNCLRSSMTTTTTFRFGNFVVSKTNDLIVRDEPNINLNQNKISIIADTILNVLDYRNDDYPILLANCLLKNLFFFRWNNIATNTNIIRNNTFVNNSNLLVAENPPGYNFEFSSNLFDTIVSFYNDWNCCWGPCGTSVFHRAGLYGNFSCHYCSPTPCYNCYPNASWGQGTCVIFSASNSLFPDPTKPGFFKWTYNGRNLPCTVPTSSQPLVLTRIIGDTTTITNSGNPNNEYYDINLTINDRGRTGGPYSILNYNPTFNPSNGKAFIFDLEMPTDLFPNQPVDIKAKGFHRN
jgi:hypothetical protein